MTGILGIFIGLGLAGLILLIIWVIYSIRNRYSIVLFVGKLTKKEKNELVEAINKTNPKRIIRRK